MPDQVRHDEPYMSKFHVKLLVLPIRLIKDEHFYPKGGESALRR
jgi:hypothetical protein